MQPVEMFKHTFIKGSYPPALHVYAIDYDDASDDITDKEVMKVHDWHTQREFKLTLEDLDLTLDSHRC